jgi:hypothetical protein
MTHLFVSDWGRKEPQQQQHHDIEKVLPSYAAALPVLEKAIEIGGEKLEADYARIYKNVLLESNEEFFRFFNEAGRNLDRFNKLDWVIDIQAQYKFKIVVGALERQFRRSIPLAEYIAEQVWAYSKQPNIRDCVDIARMAETEQEASNGWLKVLERLSNS